MTRYIEHVTLNTGHTRRSPRSEVTGAAVLYAGAMLAAALSGGRPPVYPEGDYTLTATAEGRCLMATVWSGAVPLVTIGVAAHSRCGAAMWRLLHDDVHMSAPLVTRRDRVPPEPWCAARLHPTIVTDMPSTDWLGDFERLLAWAWIDRRA